MLSQDVYQILLQQLMNGTLAPGEILNRRTLAQQLGTSTAPVLEALKQLEFDGYIETVPRKYTRVKPIQADDVLANYLMRAAIEGMAVRLWVHHGRTTAQYEALYRLAAELETHFAVGKAEAPARWHAERAFHGALVAASGNEKLLAEFHRIALPNFFFRTEYILKSSGILHSDHIELLDALFAAPDGAAAEQLIRAHIVNGRTLVSTIMQ